MPMNNENEEKKTPKSWSVPSLRSSSEATNTSGLGYARDFKHGFEVRNKYNKPCHVTELSTPREENTSGTDTSSSDYNTKSPTFVVSPKKRRKATHETSWTAYDQERSLSEEEHGNNPCGVNVLAAASASLSKSFTNVGNMAYFVPDWSAAGEECIEDMESSSDVKDDNDYEDVSKITNEDEAFNSDGLNDTVKNRPSVMYNTGVLSAAKCAIGDGKPGFVHGAHASGDEYLNLCGIDLLENETPPKLWSSDASCAEDLTDQCALSSSLKTSECMEGSKASLCVEGLLSDEEVESHLANAADMVVQSIIQEEAKAVSMGATPTLNLSKKATDKSETESRKDGYKVDCKSTQSTTTIQSSGKSKVKEQQCNQNNSQDATKDDATSLGEKTAGFGYSGQNTDSATLSADQVCKKKNSDAKLQTSSWSLKMEDKVNESQDSVQEKPNKSRSHDGMVMTFTSRESLVSNTLSNHSNRTLLAHLNTSIDDKMVMPVSRELLKAKSQEEHTLTRTEYPDDCEASGRVLTVSLEKLHLLRKRSGNNSRVPIAVKDTGSKLTEETDPESPQEDPDCNIKQSSATLEPVTKRTDGGSDSILNTLLNSKPTHKLFLGKKMTGENGNTRTVLSEHPSEKHSKSPVGSASTGALVKPHVSFSRNSSRESMGSSSGMSLRVGDATRSESLCTSSTLEKSSNSLKESMGVPSLAGIERGDLKQLTSVKNQELLSSRDVPKDRVGLGSSWVKKRARPHSANINREALQEGVARLQVSNSSDCTKQRPRTVHKTAHIVDKSCFEVRSDECISSASVVSPSGVSENVDVDSPSWSNESVSKYREYAKMRKRELLARFVAERRHREELDQLLAQLHDSYDKLLAKHAEAENTIDQLRLGKPMKLETSRLSPQVHFVHTSSSQGTNDSHSKSNTTSTGSPKSRHSDVRSQDSRTPMRRSVAVGANLFPHFEGHSGSKQLKDCSSQTDIPFLSSQESFRTSVASLLLRANCLLEQVNSLHECVIEGITIDPVVGQQMCTYLWESLMSLQRDVVTHTSQGASLEDIALDDAKCLLTKIQGKLLSIHPKETNLTLSLCSSKSSGSGCLTEMPSALPDYLKLATNIKVPSSNVTAAGDLSCYGSLPASPSVSSHSHHTDVYADGDSGCHSTDKPFHQTLTDDPCSQASQLEPRPRKSSSSCFSDMEKLESKSSNESECIDVVKTLLRAIHSEELRSGLLSKRSGTPRISPKPGGGGANSDSDLEYMCGNSFNFQTPEEQAAETASKRSSEEKVCDSGYTEEGDFANDDDVKPVEEYDEKADVKSVKSVMSDAASRTNVSIVSLGRKQSSVQQNIQSRAESACSIKELKPCTASSCSSLSTVLNSEQKKKLDDTIRVLSCETSGSDLDNASRISAPVGNESNVETQSLPVKPKSPLLVVEISEESKKPPQEPECLLTEPISRIHSGNKNEIDNLVLHAAQIQKVCDVLREQLNMLHTTPTDPLVGVELNVTSKEDMVMQLLEEVRFRLSGTKNAPEVEAPSSGETTHMSSPFKMLVEKDYENSNTVPSPAGDVAPPLESPVAIAFACNDEEVTSFVNCELPVDNPQFETKCQMPATPESVLDEEPLDQNVIKDDENLSSGTEREIEMQRDSLFFAPGVSVCPAENNYVPQGVSTTYVYLTDERDCRQDRHVLEKLQEQIEQLRQDIMAKNLSSDLNALNKVCSQSCQTEVAEMQPLTNGMVGSAVCCALSRPVSACLTPVEHCMCSEMALPMSAQYSMTGLCNRCGSSVHNQHYGGQQDINYRIQDHRMRMQPCESQRLPLGSSDTVLHYCGLHHIVRKKSSQSQMDDGPMNKEEVNSQCCPFCLQQIKKSQTTNASEPDATSGTEKLADPNANGKRICIQLLSVCKSKTNELGDTAHNDEEEESSNTVSQPTSPDTYPSAGDTYQSYADGEGGKYAGSSSQQLDTNRVEAISVENSFCPVSDGNQELHKIVSNVSIKTVSSLEMDNKESRDAEAAAYHMSDSSYERVSCSKNGVNGGGDANSPWTEETDTSEDETVSESLPGVLQTFRERGRTIGIGRSSPSLSEEQSWSSHQWRNTFGNKELNDADEVKKRISPVKELDQDHVLDGSTLNALLFQESRTSMFEEASDTCIRKDSCTSPCLILEDENADHDGEGAENNCTDGFAIRETLFTGSFNRSSLFSFPLGETSPTSYCTSPVQHATSDDHQMQASPSSHDFNLSAGTDGTGFGKNTIESEVMMPVCHEYLGNKEYNSDAQTVTMDNLYGPVEDSEWPEKKPSPVTPPLYDDLGEKQMEDDDDKIDREVIEEEEEESASPENNDLQCVSVGIQAEPSQCDADIQVWPSRRDMDTQMTSTPRVSQETDAEISTMSKEDGGDNTEEEATFPRSEASVRSSLQGQLECEKAPSDTSHHRRSDNINRKHSHNLHSGSESQKVRSRHSKSNNRLGKVMVKRVHQCPSTSSGTSQLGTQDSSQAMEQQHSCKSCARLLRKTEALANTMLKELKNEPLSCDESSEEEIEIKKLQLVHALDLANKIAKRLKHHSVQMLHSLSTDAEHGVKGDI